MSSQKPMDPHIREMLTAMSDVELAALENELLERLAVREDRYVFSEEKEDSVVSFGTFVVGFVLSICVYQLLQFFYLHVAADDAEWNVFLLYLISGVVGFGGAVWIFSRVEDRLRAGLMYVVRRREYLIYLAMFALAVVSRK